MAVVGSRARVGDIVVLRGHGAQDQTIHTRMSKMKANGFQIKQGACAF